MYRKIAAEALARFLGVIAHSERIRIIEELRQGELDVSALQEKLGMAQSNVSRHLGILKAQQVVIERKAGRRVYYQLSLPYLAEWLLAGLDIIEERSSLGAPLAKAVSNAKELWSIEFLKEREESNEKTPS